MELCNSDIFRVSETASATDRESITSLPIASRNVNPPSEGPSTGDTMPHDPVAQQAPTHFDRFQTPFLAGAKALVLTDIEGRGVLAVLDIATGSMVSTNPALWWRVLCQNAGVLIGLER